MTLDETLWDHGTTPPCCLTGRNRCLIINQSLMLHEEVFAMPSITIRNLDERTKQRLRIRAAVHNRSMEEEARDILRSILNTETETPRLAERIQARFGPDGGVDLELPPREPMRPAPEFE